jgi:LytS/YehU family sensor histidine kinase
MLLFILVYLVHIFTYEYLSDFLFPGFYLIAFYDWLEMLKYFIIYVGISTIFILSKSWIDLIDSKKRLAELEKENLKNELRALKSQINPHFLFNSLNSIYSLALKKSNDTPEVILKLSDVLRYVIYESNEPLVDLEKELKFIGNYIDLQKLRHKYPDNISLNMEGITDGIKIAPLIFIVFIENAIKHGLVGIGKDDFVNIRFNTGEDEIKMIAGNSYYPEKTVDKKEGGIGLENAKRRLDLAYPGRYDLIVNSHDNVYKVELNIQFK